MAVRTLPRKPPSFIIPMSGASFVTLAVRELGFPIADLGVSNQPLIPQRIGDWWMEPDPDPAKLPERAVYQLEELVSYCQRQKVPVLGVVLFHEIAERPRTPVLAPIQRKASELSLWVEQSATFRLQQAQANALQLGHATRSAGVAVGVAARDNGPHLLRTLGLAAGAILGMAVILGYASAHIVTAAAQGIDPCLCLVIRDPGTGESRWLEVSRWLD